MRCCGSIQRGEAGKREKRERESMLVTRYYKINRTEQFKVTHLFHYPQIYERADPITSETTTVIKKAHMPALNSESTGFRVDLHCITSLPITGLCSQQWEPSSPLSVSSSFSLSDPIALTVPHPLQSTPLLNTQALHAHTHTPTDFQNKNPAVYQAGESRTESHFAFQRVFEVPAQMLLSSLFYFYIM